MSTDIATRSVLLRDGDQFETSAGRWSIQHDDEHGTIQNSMRPPPLPEPPLENDLEPLDLNQQSKTVPLRPTSTAPAEIDENVNDVPYSEDPAFEGKANAPMSAAPSNDETTDADQTVKSSAESSLDILNDALDGLDESALSETESLPQTKATSHAEVTKDTSGAGPEPATVDGKNTPVEEHPQKQKRQHSSTERRSRKKRRGSKGSVRFTEASEEPLVEETVVVEAVPKEPENTPSPAKKKSERRSRSAREPPPKSTPEPTPSYAAKESPISGSQRSTRSRKSESTPESSFETWDGSPVVWFSSNTTIDEKTITMKTFYDLGGKKAKSIGEMNMLCVVDGRLKKSEAFLVAIAQGADIVTEAWVVETHRKARFPDPSRFLPAVKEHERAWGFRLRDAVSRGKNGLTHLLAGTTVFITAEFRTQMGKTCTQSITNVALALGAEGVKPVPRNGRKPKRAAFAIGMENDPEGNEVQRLGMSLYDKELVTSTVLQGNVNLDGDDYRITVPVKEEQDD